MKLLVLSDLHVEHAAFMPNPVTLAAADAVVAEIHAAGGKARAAKCSVADAEAVQSMVADVLAETIRRINNDESVSSLFIE